MEITVMIMGILLVALLYLHIKQSHLIFQHDIKVARALAVILLCVQGATNLLLSVILLNRDPNAARFWIFCNAITVWTLMILIFWKILSACRKDTFFKKNSMPGQSLREKIIGIILEVVQKNQLTPDFKVFIETDFEDAVIESVRRECNLFAYYGPYDGEKYFSQRDLDKLKALAVQLG